MTTWNLLISDPTDSDFLFLLPYYMRFERSGSYIFQFINDLPQMNYNISIVADNTKTFAVFGMDDGIHGYRTMSGKQVSNLGSIYQFTITYAHNNVEQSGVVANRFPI